eukprot:scaffold83553_cov25-Tisochrysis_lutea.AAC.4
MGLASFGAAGDAGVRGVWRGAWRRSTHQRCLCLSIERELSPVAVDSGLMQISSLDAWCVGSSLDSGAWPRVAAEKPEA